MLSGSFDPDIEMEGCGSLCAVLKFGSKSCDSWDLFYIFTGDNGNFGDLKGALGTCDAFFDGVKLEEICGFSLVVDLNILIHLKTIPALRVPFPLFSMQDPWVAQLVLLFSKVSIEPFSCANQKDFLLTDGSQVVESKVALLPKGMDK